MKKYRVRWANGILNSYSSLKDARSYRDAVNGYQNRLPDTALHTTFYIERWNGEEWVTTK